jgi:hypothetical protein
MFDLNIEPQTKRRNVMSEREYYWFIEPKDDRANEIIFRLLKEHNLDEDCGNYDCEDGPHNLWRCNHQIISYLNRSYRKLNYTVWVQEDRGLIRRWILGGPSKSPRKKQTAVHERPRTVETSK